MAAVHDFENVVTAVSDVSCNIVQLRYAVFFLGVAPAIAVARHMDFRVPNPYIHIKEEHSL